MSTLQKLEKGDSVILCAFTGMKMAKYEIISTDDKTITIEKKNGQQLVFDKGTGKQKNVAKGKERYACSIIIDDGTYNPPNSAARRKKKSKK